MADGKARRSLGKVAIAAGMIAIAISIASRWITVGWSQGTPGWSVGIASGEVRVAYWSSMGGAPPPVGWTAGLSKHPSGPNILDTSHANSYVGLVVVTKLNGFGIVGTGVTVLAMIPTMCLVLAGLGLWSWGRRAFRSGTDRCATCGYASVGLVPGAKCPECGNSPRLFPNRTLHPKP